MLGVRRAREIEQVVVLGIVESQGLADGVEHRLGHPAGVAALELGVVLDADPRQERHLAAPEARHPPLPSEHRQPRPRRRDLRPSRGEKLADVIFVTHDAPTLRGGTTPWEVPAVPLLGVPL